MYFNGKIEVVITDQVTGVKKHLQTVVSVSAHNDSQHIGADCDVVVPLNCRIQYVNGKHDYLTDQTKNLFKSGDKISIRATYAGMYWINVFQGFITDFNVGNPTTIKCMDYVYKLNLSTIDVSYKTITLKDLLTNILNGTGITLSKDIMEMSLENIAFKLMSPAAILEWLKKEMGINISLSGTDLYCNIASNTLSTVKFDSSINVLTCDLQKPYSIFSKFKVKAWFIREDSTKDSIEVGDPDGQLREVFYYRVTPRTEANYKKMATDALLKFKQNKYQGGITTLLYPDCDLFWKAEYKDVRYPERSGNYTITANDITLDESGFHRSLKLAFLSDSI